MAPEYLLIGTGHVAVFHAVLDNHTRHYMLPPFLPLPLIIFHSSIAGWNLQSYCQ